MGRIAEALARVEGQTRPASSLEEVVIPWNFDAPADAGRSEVSVPVTELLRSELAAPAVTPRARIITPATRKEPILDAVSPETAARLVTSPSLAATIKEQYRRLAATLHQAQRNEGVRVLMIASAVPDEGKTLIAANLALTLSRSLERRVLMIDADLRKPSLHGLFGVRDDEHGLAQCLDRTAGPVVPLQLSPKLSLVPAGRVQGESMRVVTSDVMQRVIHEATAAFDWVILDTPPVGLLADAHILAAMADKVLFVISAGTTPYDLIKQSVDVLGRDRIIGTVLNRADKSQVTPHSYQDDYYEAPAVAAES